ncbi:MAG: membrane protein insertase YidC [Desulfobacteraceae bacterium]|nr:membrane protein insertase YidC [Desulfobacteraceae bacterium]
MDEQKRLILAIVLSVIVLVGFQFLFVKPQDNTQQPKQVIDQAGQQDQKTQSTKSAAKVSDFTTTDQPAAGEQALVKPKDFRTIRVSTPLYNIVISEAGVVIKNCELKDYKDTNQKDAPFKQMVATDLIPGVFSMDLAGHSIQGLKDAVFTADVDSLDTQVTNDKKSITFSLKTSLGITVKKVFTFWPDSYLIDCDIIFQNGSGAPLNDNIIISIPGPFTKEIDKRSRFAYEGPMAYINSEFIKLKPDDIEEKDTHHGTVDWAGYTDRYFLTSVMPKTPLDTKLKLTFADEIVTTNFFQPMERLDPGKQATYSFTYYMGPKSLKILSQYDNALKKAINFGWFDVIAKPLLITMNYIYKVIPNYGVAIILLTILIKILFWPLGTKSYKSMNEMKKVQPLMMEIREKYKDDKQRMNQEIVGLYKTYKVNPASGCLPLLVQMPIFFALYRMLYMAIELRHASFLGWINDLSSPDRLFHFDFTIPMMQPPFGIPVLTLLMGASFLLQQKMAPTAGDPMQAKMMMLMPIFMTVLFINFPAGLVLYMLVNNVISMGQQYYIQKKFSK